MIIPMTATHHERLRAGGEPKQLQDARDAQDAQDGRALQPALDEKDVN